MLFDWLIHSDAILFSSCLVQLVSVRPLGEDEALTLACVVPAAFGGWRAEQTRESLKLAQCTERNAPFRQAQGGEDVATWQQFRRPALPWSKCAVVADVTARQRLR